MATVLLNDQSASESQSVSVKNLTDLEFAVCGCCGLKEECTVAYIFTVKERFHGRWICGLCSEAVKDEVVKSNGGICSEEALEIHMKFCQEFRTSPPPKPTDILIVAMRQLLCKSLDGPRSRSVSSTPNSPRTGSEKRSALARSGSCVSSLPSVVS